MKALLYPPSGPQTIGQVLDSGFRLFQASLLRCMLPGALAMIAGQTAAIYNLLTGRSLTRSAAVPSVEYFILYFVGMVLMLFLYGLLFIRQHGIASARPLSLREEVSQVLRRLPAYVGVTVISVIFVLMLGIIIGLVWGFSAAGGGGLMAVIVVGALLTPVLLYVATPVVSTTPAVLLDGKGPIEAIRYAFRLVQGAWWRSTAIYTVAVVVLIVFYFVAMVFVALMIPLLGGARDLAAIAAATAVAWVVLGGVGMPFFSAVVLCTYGELKVRKEGLDLQQRVAAVTQS
jgi:hypothetical protein